MKWTLLMSICLDSSGGVVGELSSSSPSLGKLLSRRFERSTRRRVGQLHNGVDARVEHTVLSSLV